MARRLNVNINDETVAALEQLAEDQDLSLTEVVRRAIGVYKFISDELADKEVSLQLIDEKSNQRTKLALL